MTTSLRAFIEKVANSGDGTASVYPENMTKIDIDAAKDILSRGGAKFMIEFSSLAGICFKIEVTPALRDKMSEVLNQ